MRVHTFSPPKIAKMIGVHPQSVRRWIEDGDLKGYRVGERKRWRIYREDLDEFCERSGYRILDAPEQAE